MTTLAFWLASAASALAQTCMTEELLTDTEPGPSTIMPAAIRAKSSEKTTGSGIAVLDGNQSSKRSGSSYERGKD